MGFHWHDLFGRKQVRTIVAVASESARARANRKRIEAGLHAVVDPLPPDLKAAAIARAASPDYSEGRRT